MGWAQWAAGAALAWVIAGVSILAANGNGAWALFCFGMALIFSVVAVAGFWRERRRTKAARLWEGHTLPPGYPPDLGEGPPEPTIDELRRRNPGIPDTLLMRLFPGDDSESDEQ